VDLSLSFFVTVSFYSSDAFVSLLTSNERNLEETADRYRPGIDPVSLFEEFQSFSLQPTDMMYN
jgi:hypothetical protein